MNVHIHEVSDERQIAVLTASLSVWARQYACVLMGEFYKGNLACTFFPTELSMPKMGSAVFLHGINLRKMQRAINVSTQPHQRAGECQIGDDLIRFAANATELRRNRSNCTDCWNEAAPDRRTRLSQIAFFELNVTDLEHVIEILRQPSTKYDIHSAQVSDGDGEAGEDTLIYVSIPQFTWLLDTVSDASAQLEYLSAIRDPEAAEGAMITGKHEEWLTSWASVIRNVNQLTGMQARVHDLVVAAARTLSDPDVARIAQTELDALYVSIAETTTAINVGKRDTSKRCIQRRIEVLKLAGYEFVGRRPDAAGVAWFVREMPEEEQLLAFAEGITQGVPNDSTDVPQYEINRCRDIRDMWEKKADALLKPHESKRGELSFELHQMHFLEEARRCRVVVSEAEAAARNGKLRPQEFDESLPKFKKNCKTSLERHQKTIRHNLTPVESPGYYQTLVAMSSPAAVEAADGRLPRIPPLYFLSQHQMPMLDSFTHNRVYDLALVNTAGRRVLRLFSWAVDSWSQSPDVLRKMLVAIATIAQLDPELYRLVRDTKRAINNSDQFWLHNRPNLSICLEDVLYLDDVFGVILAHFGKDVKDFTAFACVNKTLQSNAALQACLPRMRTRVANAHAQTVNFGPDRIIVRTDILLNFDTNFGFNRPRADGTSEWIDLLLKDHFRALPETGNIKLQLLFDTPNLDPVVCIGAPPLRMGANDGRRDTGTFRVDSYFIIRVIIMPRSYSYRNMHTVVYKKHVDECQSAVAATRTADTVFKLKEAVAMQERNAAHQHFRVRMTMTFSEGADSAFTQRTLHALSNPFTTAANIKAITSAGKKRVRSTDS